MERAITSVGPGGQAVSVWAGDAAAVGWYGGRWTRPPQSQRLVVTVHDESAALQSFATVDVAMPVTTVQLLPEGSVLLVGARSWWTSESGGDINAVVFDAHGAVVAQAVLGDGIAQVQTTPSGDVWVGYTDEGIYGNLGWGQPDGPTPIGAHGLNRFTSSLDLDWSFAADRERGIKPIDHCYALTVVDDDAWACTYTDFDVVRMRDGEIRSWTSKVEGPSAIAVADDRIALLGGYGRDRDRLVLARLGQTALEDLQKSRLSLPNGDPLPERAHVTGRGADLHVFVDDTWLQLAIGQLDLG